MRIEFACWRSRWRRLIDADWRTRLDTVRQQFARNASSRARLKTWGNRSFRKPALSPAGRRLWKQPRKIAPPYTSACIFTLVYIIHTVWFCRMLNFEWQRCYSKPSWVNKLMFTFRIQFASEVFLLMVSMTLAAKISDGTFKFWQSCVAFN